MVDERGLIPLIDGVMYSPLQVFLSGAFFVFAYVCIWALYAILKKRADLADVAWGLGIFLVAWISFFLSSKTVYSLIFNLFISIWSLRLSAHIYLRNQSRAEDFRYQNLKKQWKKNGSLRLFSNVFLLQGGILYLVSLPIIWINIQSQELTSNILWIILPFFAVGFLLETISDYHLACFQKNRFNQGKLLMSGLWKYVRHPNYLGEIIIWWSIGVICLFLPFGWIFILSPLLMTYLIIKVSGVAPLEEKMKAHPDFALYAKKTASIVPLSFVNIAIFISACSLIVHFGRFSFFWIPFFVFIISCVLQIYLFFKSDEKSFLVCLPLSVYSLFLGVSQEFMFINFGVISYSNKEIIPPFWLGFLYLLFSLTLNSSLRFLNRSLSLAFCFGGLGLLFFYHYLDHLGIAETTFQFSYPVIFIFWGSFLTLLIILNRKLIALREKYTDPKNLSNPITVFFDSQCPICYREMCALKKRKQIGVVNYETAKSDLDLRKITTLFSYKQAMEKIHGLDSRGNIFTGIDVLAELYARTNLPFISILIQAPGFRLIFKIAYAIWAKLRYRK